jgi:hypothetical protein
MAAAQDELISESLDEPFDVGRTCLLDRIAWDDFEQAAMLNNEISSSRLPRNRCTTASVADQFVKSIFIEYDGQTMPCIHSDMEFLKSSDSTLLTRDREVISAAVQCREETTTVANERTQASPSTSFSKKGKGEKLQGCKQAVSRRHWTAVEEECFLQALHRFGPKEVDFDPITGRISVRLGPGVAEMISMAVGTRTVTQIRSHVQKHYIRLEREASRHASMQRGIFRVGGLFALCPYPAISIAGLRMACDEAMLRVSTQDK